MNEAFIYDAVRSPRGRGNKDGGLHTVTAVDLSAQMIDALIERNAFDSADIEDLIWGNVTQIGEQGGCLARAAGLLSKLEHRVPGLSINRFCASGLEAVNLAVGQIRAGDGRAYIAGGVEMMSRVPMGSDGAAAAVDPRLALDCAFVPQGISADLIATKYGFTRADCDEYAVESQRRASMAWDNGRFDRSVIPAKDINGLEILSRDEHLRPGTDIAALSGLKPSFADIGTAMPGFDKVAMLKYPEIERIDHVHHAGNSSGIVDGAAAVLIGNAEFGKDRGLAPRARVVSTAKVGSEPTIMLTGPIPASERALQRAGLAAADIDLFEVNEAFAAVPLRFMQHFDVPWHKVNNNGGAISLGHPLGATGAVLLSTALDELERADLSTSLLTLCVGGGMGVATIIERV